jgi:DNA-binding TFAR19-related protein (PDSD5 family)
MSNKSKGAAIQLERLREKLLADLEQMSDRELLAEATEEYGSLEAASKGVQAIFANAIGAAAKGRLARAKAGSAALGKAAGSNVVQLSLERKKALIQQVSNRAGIEGQKFTMAARSGADGEADIDGLLEDLVELGVIDEQGNVK